MVNSISDFFSDEELVQSFRLQFDYEEMFDFDFTSVFSQITDFDDDNFQLRLRGRVFLIDKVTGGINEVVE